jgi:hypothetical protein
MTHSIALSFSWEELPSRENNITLFRDKYVDDVCFHQIESPHQRFADSVCVEVLRVNVLYHRIVESIIHHFFHHHCHPFVR